jgi:ubiquinone/menaquinone biosynthesis C-methylase UbiE
VWADLGAGTGAFTLALRELVGPEAEIHAVDKDAASLQTLQRAYARRFGAAEGLHLLRADLSGELGLPPLDGVLMANSLHFFQDKKPVLERVRRLLKPEGVLLLVEYNVDRGNPWVPFPLSFETFAELAPKAGFRTPRLMATHPSSFLKEFYSAASFAA